MRINRDVIVAIVLLITCGFFISESFVIREATLGQMSSALWPLIILVPLTVLSFIFLVTSLFQERSEGEKKGGFVGWLKYYKNPIFIFGFFAIFVATLPLFGMLVGGLLFVFVTLSYFGGWDRRSLVIHGVIACVTVGFMWSVFTFALGVILPQGELFYGIIAGI
jgi:putative tricarboxylic transport membrane protein